MTREEAIKLLTQYIDYDAETPDYYEMEKACKVALKVLKQEPCEGCDYKEWLKGEVEPKTEWIPVSERLPEAGEYIGDVAKYYLVQNEYGDMLVARYTHSEYWEQMYQLKPIADEIVAWMPLPEPYKAESEDKDIAERSDK